VPKFYGISPEKNMSEAPQNPIHFQVALNETNAQIQLLSSRAQQLAVELYEARQLVTALEQQLAEKTSLSQEKMIPMKQ
jgi:hypothetical protein